MLRDAIEAVSRVAHRLSSEEIIMVFMVFGAVQNENTIFHLASHRRTCREREK